jgi:hypothetical protein
MQDGEVVFGGGVEEEEHMHGSSVLKNRRHLQDQSNRSDLIRMRFKPRN